VAWLWQSKEVAIAAEQACALQGDVLVFNVENSVGMK
jgi:hypothetical protein